jgi:hypothetical protein
VQKLTDLADTYANASPDLWDFLHNAVTTLRTLNEQQRNLDSALMASVGFGNTGADIFEHGGPYLVRGTEDLLTTSHGLDEYSPMIYCMIFKWWKVAPKAAEATGGNGYSLGLQDEVLPGAGNPWVYPDNFAAGERPWWSRGPTGLLARSDKRPVAGPVSGDGHRCFNRAVQPHRHRPAVRHRLRLGPPNWGEHDQPVDAGCYELMRRSGSGPPHPWPRPVLRLSSKVGVVVGRPR